VACNFLAYQVFDTIVSFHIKELRSPLMIAHHVVSGTLALWMSVSRRPFCQYVGYLTGCSLTRSAWPLLPPPLPSLSILYTATTPTSNTTAATFLAISITIHHRASTAYALHNRARTRTRRYYCIFFGGVCEISSIFYCIISYSYAVAGLSPAQIRGKFFVQS
jgi:hypothetical protein